MNEGKIKAKGRVLRAAAPIRYCTVQYSIDCEYDAMTAREFPGVQLR